MSADQTPPLTARAVTRVLTRAGFPGIRSSLVSDGTVRVEQRYLVRGALTPADTRARREQRARLIAEQLVAEGWQAVPVFDRVTVTESRGHR